MMYFPIEKNYKFQEKWRGREVYKFSSHIFIVIAMIKKKKNTFSPNNYGLQIKRFSKIDEIVWVFVRNVRLYENDSVVYSPKAFLMKSRPGFVPKKQKLPVKTGSGQ